MTIYLELNRFDYVLLALSFGFIAIGIAKAMGWALTSPRHFTPAISFVLNGNALLVFHLGPLLRNAEDQQFLELWSFIIFVLLFCAATALERRARPPRKYDEAAQLINDFSRMYGKSSDDATK